MAQVTEPRSSQSASSQSQSTIQDVFLNFARRDRLSVTIHLMDGRHLEARIKNFDKFAVVVEKMMIGCIRVPPIAMPWPRGAAPAASAGNGAKTAVQPSPSRATPLRSAVFPHGRLFAPQCD